MKNAAEQNELYEIEYKKNVHSNNTLLQTGYSFGKCNAQNRIGNMAHKIYLYVTWVVIVEKNF